MHILSAFKIFVHQTKYFLHNKNLVIIHRYHYQYKLLSHKLLCKTKFHMVVTIEDTNRRWKFLAVIMDQKRYH